MNLGVHDVSALGITNLARPFANAVELLDQEAFWWQPLGVPSPKQKSQRIPHPFTFPQGVQ